MLCYVMLHDFVVSMGVNTNVWIMGETIVHDAAEYAVNIGITGYTMDYMIRLPIVQPLTFIYIKNVGSGDGRKAK
jgi:hypothetical protein